MNKNILIVNFNTTFLTQCCIKSVNKHTPGCKIYVFDNSDKEPFVNIFDNVKVIDNTKGQIINWEEWEKCFIGNKTTKGRHNNYASAKHCYTIEKFMENFDENFLLLDSDVLVKCDISELFNNNYLYIGEVKKQTGFSMKRVIPFICFINNKMCHEYNIHYFNEKFMHGLGHGEGDDWDTGTYFYKASEGKNSKEINYNNYIIHLGSGSWLKSKKEKSNEWLNKNKNLWE